MNHAGLAMVRTAGLLNGKVPDVRRGEWIDGICSIKEVAGYSGFFANWQSTLSTLPGRSEATLTSSSRTLIGHGLPSSHEVGLQLHHTYGLPFIPGSALKGVLAHYVHVALGSKSSDWKGPKLDDRGAVIEEPGERFKALFGSAPSVKDEQGSEGYVEFHDALLKSGQDSPLKPDVLTPHQAGYYRELGAAYPNDYTSPIPIQFVTARPGLAYHLVLTGEASWVELAMGLLKLALQDHGIGGKTSSGYGRFVLEEILSPERVQQKIDEQKRRDGIKRAEQSFQSAVRNARGPQHGGAIRQAFRACIDNKVLPAFCAQIVKGITDRQVRKLMDGVFAENPWPELAVLLVEEPVVEPANVVMPVAEPANVVAAVRTKVRAWIKNGRELMWCVGDQAPTAKAAMNLRYFSSDGEPIKSPDAIKRLCTEKPKLENVEIEFNGTKPGKVILL